MRSLSLACQREKSGVSILCHRLLVVRDSRPSLNLRVCANTDIKSEGEATQEVRTGVSQTQTNGDAGDEKPTSLFRQKRSCTGLEEQPAQQLEA